MAHRNWNRSGNMNYYAGGMSRVGSSYSHNSYGGSGGSGKQHRAIYGTVTKLFENFGYVDDEIFFMKSVVRGPLPRVGDRVMCEANYQPNMPVKWNAEMVRLLDKGGRGGGPGRSGPLSRHRPDSNRSRDDSSRDDRGKRPRPGRYDVTVPVHPFTINEATVPLIRSRYPNLYVPSDFFQCNFRWLDVFPMHQPMKLGHNSSFYIIHRDVESLVDRGDESILEPADADYTYSAKVMLLATPTLAELYRRACRLAEDKDVQNDDQAYRLIQFLVGVKGRNDLMPIGGPWSPSLDGENPAEDHHVLVNTAVRTCKALTGIDLSQCTQWFRFLELYYYRPAEKSSKTGKMREARVETVVVFVPDIWSCMPSEEDWKTTRDTYQELLDRKLNPPEPEPQVELMEAIDEAVDEEASAAAGAEDATVGEEDQQPAAAEEEESAPAQAEDANETEGKSDQPTHYASLDPKTMKVAELKHELEVRGLSSKGLKAQLTARLTKTLEEEEAEEKKAKQLTDAAAKEEKAMDADETEKSATEQEKDGETDAAKAESETAEAKADETPAPVELTEKERRRLERIYTLPENPTIVCHPNINAKSGKFDVQVFSLKHLLDYRMDGGAKEYTYEVSLFAEQFNHMLQRDSAFSIYKAMVVAPEPVRDDTEEKKDQSVTDEEPDAKRSRKDADTSSVSAKSDKEATTVVDAPRTIRRTVDSGLLFSFVYFDRLHAGYMIDKDIESVVHGLGLSLSRSQIRRLIAKLVTSSGRSSSMIHYRNLTDKDVVEGAADDVTSLRMAELDDDDYVLELSMGNRALWDEDAKPMAARVSGLIGEDDMVKKVEKAEDLRVKMELQFKQIKEELETTRKDLGRAENAETKMGEEIRSLTDKVRSHRHAEEELRGLNATYQRMLRYSREQCERVTKEISAQFDKEKEKRDRERERERKEKEEKEAKEKEAKGETEEKKEEKKEEKEEKEETTDVQAENAEKENGETEENDTEEKMEAEEVEEKDKSGSK